MGKKFTFTYSILFPNQEREENNMGLEIKTDRDLDEFEEMRYITITEEENLIYLFTSDNSNYRSFFSFSYRDKTVSDRFVGYAGAISTQNDEKYESGASFDGFPKYVDIYVTANGMKTPFKRTADQLINLRNLVIDIDSHDSEMSIQELNEHIKQFEKELTEKLLIKPNLINKTGRGLHLWYCIEPCHVALNKICMAVVDMLCNHIKDIMKEIDETELSIDRTSSLKLNGLFRLPYTYNTKAGIWSEVTEIHKEEPNINDLYKQLKEHKYKSRYFKDKDERKPKVDNYNYEFKKDLKNNDYTPCLIHRKKFMDYLFKTREIKKGSRNTMLFVMYATLIMLMDKESAREYCEILNTGFLDPLPYGELLATFKQVDKGSYRFKNKKFFELVKPNEEEMKWFNKATLKEQRRQEKRNEKIERNNKIRELKRQGVPITQISKIMKLSRPAIYNIINSEN